MPDDAQIRVPKIVRIWKQFSKGRRDIERALESSNMDKFEVQCSAPVKFEVLIGYYGSSSVYQKVCCWNEVVESGAAEEALCRLWREYLLKVEEVLEQRAREEVDSIRKQAETVLAVCETLKGERP